jgi:hypothetical protein
LKAVYPEHPWEASRFAKRANNYWKDKANQKAFLDELAVKLNVKKPEDWYSVVTSQIEKNGGVSLLRYYRGSFRRGNGVVSYRILISLALAELIPEFEWDQTKFTQFSKGYWKGSIT